MPLISILKLIKSSNLVLRVLEVDEVIKGGDKADKIIKYSSKFKS